VTFSLIGKFFISMQIVTVNMLTAEVFPTASRGLTIGLCSTVGKVGGILAPVMSAMVSEYTFGLGAIFADLICAVLFRQKGAKNRSLPYIVFGCTNLVVGALSLMLPETKGLSIPATIQDAKDLES
jgi:OCT family organic cation transporter-like MFS transporter 4/5